MSSAPRASTASTLAPPFPGAGKNRSTHSCSVPTATSSACAAANRPSPAAGTTGCWLTTTPSASCARIPTPGCWSCSPGRPSTGTFTFPALPSTSHAPASCSTPGKCTRWSRAHPGTGKPSQFPARVPARRDRQWRFRPRAPPCSSGGSRRLLPLACGAGRAAAFLPVPSGRGTSLRAGGLPRPGSVTRGVSEVLGLRGYLQPQCIHLRGDGRGIVPGRLLRLSLRRGLIPRAPRPLRRSAPPFLRVGGGLRTDFNGSTVRSGEASDRRLLLLLAFHVDVEHVADRFFLDRLCHREEHLVAVIAVFHKRLALGHRSQPDTVLEVVHLVQVLTPLAVEHGKQDPAFKLAHDLRGEFLFPVLVRDPCIRDEFGDEVLSVQAHEAAGLLNHFLRGDRNGEHLAQFAPQVVQIPFVG